MALVWSTFHQPLHMIKLLFKVYIFWEVTKFCEIFRWRFRKILWPSLNIWTLCKRSMIFKRCYEVVRINIWKLKPLEIILVCHLVLFIVQVLCRPIMRQSITTPAVTDLYRSFCKNSGYSCCLKVRKSHKQLCSHIL